MPDKTATNTAPEAPKAGEKKQAAPLRLPDDVKATLATLGTTLASLENSEEDVSKAKVDAVETMAREMPDINSLTSGQSSALRAMIKEQMGSMYASESSIKAATSTLELCVRFMVQNNLKTVFDAMQYVKYKGTTSADNLAKGIRAFKRDAVGEGNGTSGSGNQGAAAKKAGAGEGLTAAEKVLVKLVTSPDPKDWRKAMVALFKQQDADGRAEAIKMLSAVK